MERITATIMQGDTVIVQNATVMIDVPSGGGIKRWSGYISDPGGLPLKANVIYRLIATDGRQDDFTVSMALLGKRAAATTGITGTGSLK